MPPKPAVIRVTLNNRQSAHPIDAARLKEAVRLVLEAEKVTAAKVSIAVVDNATIHELNRRFLQHDFPTDVLTFPLNDAHQDLEGEIVVSAEYAATEAPEYGWSVDEELLLYVIHGALHLVDYDDKTPAAESAMRAAERRYLAKLGIQRDT